MNQLKISKINLSLVVLILFLSAGCNKNQNTTSPVVENSSKSIAVPPQIPSVTKPKITKIYGVGEISRHAFGFIGKVVAMQGYVLKKENGYVIFSDEDYGAIGVYDLPVSGTGVENMLLKQKYLLQGIFLSKGLVASNKSSNHLELTALPKITQ